MTDFVDRSIPGIKPGSAEWMKYMSASKVAAVMGHSTYDSWFSLWHRMKGNVAKQGDDDTTRRGHYLEPAIIAWFQDQHPDWTFTPTGMWIHPTVEWAAATPDKIGHTPEGAVIVEAKTSDLDFEWGEPGTDAIPPGYYDQVQWQMWVTGLRTAYVPVLMSRLQFAEYVIQYDPDHVKEMVTRTVEFMRTLAHNEKPSIDPLDGHQQTYRALKELNPGINDVSVDVHPDLANEFLRANAAVKAAEYRLQAAKNVLAEAAGEAHYVYIGKQKLLTRQSKGGGLPYFVAARNLPAELELENV